MFESVAGLIAEHRAVKEELSTRPCTPTPPGRSASTCATAELSRIVAAHDAWVAASADLEAARELAREDDAFADEVPVLEARLAAAQEKLRRLLIPRDPDDARAT
ncbi:PCRF domain-containing protein [Pseudoxanthomonas mexicana]